MVVVGKAAVGLHGSAQAILTGVAEGGVAEVVGEGQGFGQILVQRQVAAQGAGDLGDFEAVGEARAVVIALVIDEDLGFVFQPAEGGRMDDAVPVALVATAHGALRLAVEAAFGGIGVAGEGG